MSDDRNEYDLQAEHFLRTFKLGLTLTHAEDKPSAWGADERQHWRVRLFREDDRRKALAFDFWNSQHDTDRGVALRPYSVLASLGSDVSLPTDPDELIAELGPMKISLALASVKFTKKLQAFFSDDEQTALAEIQ